MENEASVDESVRQVFDSERFRESGHQLIDQLADFLSQSVSPAGLGSTDNGCKVLDYQDENELYRFWKAIKPGQLSVQELFSRVMQQSIRLHHPKYMGHQISPVSTAAALAGLVSDLLNNGMGVYEMGMAGTVLERVVIELTAERFGFGDSAAGVLTSGGSLGNLTSLLAARKFVATRDSDSNSVLEPGKSVVIVSEQAHYCIQRAVGVMGLGSEALVTVPTNNKFQLDIESLPELLDQIERSGRVVIAVVGSACSTATGSYDDLRRIGEFCQQNNLWFHIDGAHGAAAAFSEKYRCLVDGMELADSVVLDFHKLLLVPALATAVVFRDGQQAYGTFAQKAQYLFSEDQQDKQWHNLALRTFECTKLMMSLKIYSVFCEHGFSVWDANVTQLYDRAQEFAALVGQCHRMETLLEPQSNIVCYRFLPEDMNRADEINRTIRERILHAGQFYIVQTTIDETFWLRSTFGSAMTTNSDLRQLCAEVLRLGNEIERDT